MGVGEAGGEPDLLQKPAWPQREGELRTKNLQRYRPDVSQILCEKDRGHSSAAQLSLDPVALAEALAEGAEDIRL
jgi:hypothetical protein